MLLFSHIEKLIFFADLYLRINDIWVRNWTLLEKKEKTPTKRDAIPMKVSHLDSICLITLE